MLSGPLNFLAANEHIRDLKEEADRNRHLETSATPVTRVTIRFASAADGGRLEQLAELDSGRAPSGAVLVAEVDGRLRAALALDGGAGIADPFHRGVDLIELLKVRAAQLSDQSRRARGPGSSAPRRRRLSQSHGAL